MMPKLASINNALHDSMLTVHSIWIFHATGVLLSSLTISSFLFLLHLPHPPANL